MKALLSVAKGRAYLIRQPPLSLLNLVTGAQDLLPPATAWTAAPRASACGSALPTMAARIRRATHLTSRPLLLSRLAIARAVGAEWALLDADALGRCWVDAVRALSSGADSSRCT